jgi:tetratricopeptide (TPR) repeat protein
MNLKPFLCLLLFWVQLAPTHAQTPTKAIDSLKGKLKTASTKQEKLKLYEQLTKAYYKQKDSSQTIAYAQKTLSLAQQDNHWESIWTAHYYTGQLYEELSKLPLAVQLYQKALYAAEQAKSKKRQAIIQLELGGTYFKQGKYKMALSSFQEDLKLRQELRDTNQIANAYNNIAVIYAVKSNLSKQLEYYQKALKYWEENNNEARIAMVTNNIGLMYIDLEEYPKAITYFNKSLEIKKKLKLNSKIAESYGNLGLVYEQMKEYDRALAYYQKTLQAYREQDNQPRVSILLYNMGVLYSKTKKYTQASQHLQESLEIAQKLKLQYVVACIIMTQGTVNYKLEKYTQAVEHLEDALRRFEAMGRLDKVNFTSKFLHLAYQAQGNYKAAYGALKTYQETSDSILNKEQIQKVTRLEENYRNTKQKDSLLLVQKKAKAIQASEAKVARLWIYFLLASTLGALWVIWLLWGRQKIKRSQAAQAPELKALQQQLLEEQLQRKEVEQQILKEQLQMDQAIQEGLETNLTTKDHELVKQALHLVQKNQLLDEITANLKDITKISRGIAQDKLKAVVKHIKKEAPITEVWQNFSHAFEVAHPGFYQRLQQKFPELTDYDLNLCALLHLGYDTKELATILNITPESVKKARMRLRKKLQLSDEVLTEYIRSI